MEYEEYLNLQTKKMRTHPLSKDLGVRKSNIDKFRRQLSILKENTKIEKPLLLCLGSRNGGEVRTALELGFDAIGLDLLLGSRKKEKAVLADFHYIPFKDNSFDCIFTNSLDHSIYPEVMKKEMERVLKPNGVGMIILARDNGPYGMFRFDKWDDMVKVIQSWWHVRRISDAILLITHLSNNSI